MTIKEIADLAGVSPSTVSMVLNNRAGISEETRQRIHKLLSEHGFSTTYSTRHKASKGSIRFLRYRRHGMLVDQNDSFINDIVEAAEHEARKKGYDLLMTNFDERSQDEIFSLVKGNPLQGILFLGTEFEHKDVKQLHSLGAPFIVVDNYLELEPVDCVVMNNSEIIYGAVQHLQQLGHRQIGYFCSSVEIENFRQRKEGYIKALQKLGIAYNQHHVIPLTPTLNGAYEDAGNYLKASPKLPTAMVADNDTIAIGAAKALKEFGYVIPRDISLVGFDDIPFALMTEPPLTTMHVYRDEIGICAVRRLIEKIKDNSSKARKIQLGGELVVRDSTAPPQR